MEYCLFVQVTNNISRLLKSIFYLRTFMVLERFFFLEFSKLKTDKQLA